MSFGDFIRSTMDGQPGNRFRENFAPTRMMDQANSLNAEQTSIRPMAQTSPEQMARLDAQARAAGYNNYEEMRAFLLRRQAAQGQTQGAPGQPAQPAQKPEKGNALSWHPRNALNYVREQMQKFGVGD